MSAIGAPLSAWHVAAALAAYAAYRVLARAWADSASPLRALPGPPSRSWLWGNYKELFSVDSSALQERWTEEYGTTFQYRGLLGTPRLYTTDLKALNHFMSNDYDYQKPEVAIYNIRRIVGEGVLLVEGDVHKKQRKLLNPAFGPQQIRELTGIFVEKSVELRDAWIREIAKADQDPGAPARIDVLSWLSRMTLDVIGLAGFNYKFDSLSDSPEKNELSEAFAQMFKTTSTVNAISALRGFIPALRFLRAKGDAEAKRASDTMRRIGRQLLAQSREAIREAKGARTGRPARDVLSILVRANAMDDLPESQRLSDEDVLAQIPTFLVAGHETTSVATTWALFALTQNKDAQARLRAEVAGVATDDPTMDELNALPYLEAVVRETLRVHAPVPATMRAAMKDDVVPLSAPYTDRKGVKHSSIMIKKGQTVIIPIVPINRAKHLWGDDAMEFKPERWEHVPDAVSSIPGVWGNMMSFIGGPRACVGYRFSLVEMKALLFTLIRTFEFDLAVPATDIGKKASVTSRPVLLTADPEEENQMPLLVSLVSG